MKKKLLLSSLLLSGATWLASEYFFKYAMTPFNKDTDSKVISGKDPLFSEKIWYKSFPKQKWELKVEPKIKLFANYVDHHSEKTAILLHGFMSDGDSMGAFSKMFYDMGYNILIPDARAHGRSQGKYIGYGWREKQDVLKWIKQIITKNGQNQKIVIMGQSMGGATAMMVSGMKLPKQVKCFIEDCGYSTVKEEVTYQAQQTVGLPSPLCKPLVEGVSVINKRRNKFFLEEASSIKQLKKNTRPIFFIHGKRDHVVPTKMVYENYKATNAPKELWVTQLASHAQSYPMYKEEYEEKVRMFLQKYVR